MYEQYQFINWDVAHLHVLESYRETYSLYNVLFYRKKFRQIQALRSIYGSKNCKIPNTFWELLCEKAWFLSYIQIRQILISFCPIYTSYVIAGWALPVLRRFFIYVYLAGFLFFGKHVVSTGKKRQFFSFPSDMFL